MDLEILIPKGENPKEHNNCLIKLSALVAASPPWSSFDTRPEGSKGDYISV